MHLKGAIKVLLIVGTLFYPAQSKECENPNPCDSAASCEETTTGYYCECLQGYTGTGITCSDIDECDSSSANDCDVNADCTNTVGSYNCQCKSMYRGNGTLCDLDKTCEDVNPCDSHASCERTATGYRCACLQGYTGTGITCADIDECSSSSTNNCDVNADCTNTDGSYTCECKLMYHGNGTICDEKTCEDTNPCDPNASCDRTATGFRCACLQGHTGTGITCADIDECVSSSMNDCDVNADCTNTAGSYTCECKSMYRGNGTTCEDIDECAASSMNSCDVNADCTNTDGAYTCECKSMYRGNGTICEEKTCEDMNPCDSNASCNRTATGFRCACLHGYTGTGITCADIDECASSSMNDCDVNADCTNTDGSYTCECKAMYRANGTICEEKTCEDVNPCDSHASCERTTTGYRCACLQGYTGTGITCADIDECASSLMNNCDVNADCTNSDGSYTCECKSMYRGNGTICEDKKCEDLNPCDSHASCERTATGYKCACLQGYTGTGITCADIDECTSSSMNDCDVNADCKNTDGAYTCECKSMYRGNGTICEDIDECASSSLNDCDVNADCKNTNGAYTCECKSMYRGNGTICEEKTCGDLNPCDPNASCDRTATGFRCACLQGYTGTGITCVGYCMENTVGIGDVSYSFNESFEGSVSFSREKCENGRSRASITCVAEENGFTFDRSTFYEVSCNENVSTIAAEINWDSNSSNEVEIGMSRLTVAVSAGSGLGEEDRTAFVNAVTVGAETIQYKSDVLTEQTLRQIVVAADSVTNSFSDVASKGYPNTTNVTVLEQAAKLRHSVEVFSAKASLAKAVVNVVTPNIRAQVQSNLGNTAKTYNYTSPTMRMQVPKEALEQARAKGVSNSDRLVFLEYSGKSLFQSSEKYSRVLTVELGIGSKIVGLKHKVVFKTEDDIANKPVPGKYQTVRAKMRCCYYVPETLSFSQEGCYLMGDGGKRHCACDHMTSFAALLDYETVDDNVVLSTVTTVGCTLSAIALVAALMIHLNGRRNRERKHISLSINANICFVLLLVYLVFLIGVSQTDNYRLCLGVTVVLHYLLLASWSWTTVYSYSMFHSLVMLNSSRMGNHFFKRSAVFAYGLPLIIAIATFIAEYVTGASVEIDRSDGDSRMMVDHGYMAANMCWLSGDALKFGFILPAGIMLLGNYCVFIYLVFFLVRQRIKIKDKTSRKTSSRELCASVSMATTLGLTWIFGYLMLISTDHIYRDTMAWLFTISTIVQGILLFVFSIIHGAALRDRLYTSFKNSFSTIPSMRKRTLRNTKKNVTTVSTKDDYSTSSSRNSDTNLGNHCYVNSNSSLTLGSTDGCDDSTI